MRSRTAEFGSFRFLRLSMNGMRDKKKFSQNRSITRIAGKSIRQIPCVYVRLGFFSRCISAHIDPASSALTPEISQTNTRRGSSRLSV